MYFCIPLEQGLRQYSPPTLSITQWYFCIPLEQGLRRILLLILIEDQRYFCIPLEQGLRHVPIREIGFQKSIFVFH